MIHVRLRCIIRDERRGRLECAKLDISLPAFIIHNSEFFHILTDTPCVRRNCFKLRMVCVS